MPLNLKPTHKPVKAYYEALKGFKSANISHETAVRSAFQELLHHCCRQVDWKLIPEFSIKRAQQNPIRVDGALLDTFDLPRGYWEAKDSHDDLEEEVDKKFKLGYPKDNILFQAPERAILWQKNKLVLDEDITKPDRLVDTLQELFGYRQPVVMQWEEAATEFKDKIPELAKGLLARIEEERKTNQRFIRAFADFVELCRHSVNPNLSVQAVEEMLIQHLLTERIFRTVFKNSDFTRRNVIAAEIEKVIDALTSQAFSRAEFLSKFDRLYVAIEAAAETISDFAQKQHFLNTVYEKFFQGFSVKVADTHGIVYTPQPIVNFIVKSVEEILQKEFGRSLSDKGVHILDPFVGTGTFIVRVMQEIKRQALTYKYQHELHCNEVMLLPYYIASMNIEHEFFEKIGEYKPFEGICLVDTFETLEDTAKVSFFSAENTSRIEEQKRTPIFVIIGNPPYNANQVNENDNNKNRKYNVVDKRVKETYAADSNASLVNKLGDPYVKAIRWASDRIMRASRDDKNHLIKDGEGVVAFVTNGGFIDQLAFDGVRKHLEEDFDELHILDLGGNVRKNPKLSGTKHNVFGIQVGVTINLLVRRLRKGKVRKGKIFYSRVDEYATKEDKYAHLEKAGKLGGLRWKTLKPDTTFTWLKSEADQEFSSLTPIGTRESKASSSGIGTVFLLYSLGNSSNRDDVVYGFDRDLLSERINKFCDDYNAEVWSSPRIMDKELSQNHVLLFKCHG